MTVGGGGGRSRSRIKFGRAAVREKEVKARWVAVRGNR